MSGIYVLMTRGGDEFEYRVAYSNNLDSWLYRESYDESSSKYIYSGDWKLIHSIFDDSEVFFDWNQAIEAAKELSIKENKYLEDGIRVVDKFKNFSYNKS